MGDRISLLTVLAAVSFVALPAQAQFVEKQRGEVAVRQLMNVHQEKADSTSAINYNKIFYLSLGLGTAELTNLNFGLRIYDGFYATANFGVTLISNANDFGGASSASFYKVGVTWRASRSESTFLGSVEVGEAKLDVEESSPTLYIPNQAKLVSLLVGYEWHYNSGFTLGLRGGIKYSKIQTRDVQYWPGVQISAGYWFF